MVPAPPVLVSICLQQEEQEVQEPQQQQEQEQEREQGCAQTNQLLTVNCSEEGTPYQPNSV